jgi:hypothetical protein
MKIRRTDRFKKDYRTLPKDIQQRVDEKLRFLLSDPRHPSLRVHKIRGAKGLWEFSVTTKYGVPDVKADGHTPGGRPVGPAWSGAEEVGEAAMITRPRRSLQISEVFSCGLLLSSRRFWRLIWREHKLHPHPESDRFPLLQVFGTL